MNDSKAAEDFCESPIERALLNAYEKVLNETSQFIMYGVKGAGTGVSVRATYDEVPVRQPHRVYHRTQTDLVWIQFPIENYRVDFAVARICVQPAFDGDQPIGPVTVKTPIVVVECDGHDFHERTKEQAERDRARDRDLTSLGYRVARFTGSEIHRDPERCAWELSDLLDSLAVAVARV